MDAAWTDLARRLGAALTPLAPAVRAVGGAVRDRLLGIEPRDLDLLVEADADAERRALAALTALAGREPVVFDRRPPATHRVAVSGRVVDVSFHPPGGLEPALRRRDFTVNAMAAPLAVLAGAASPAAFRASVIDPAGGLADLDARRIAAAGPSSLADDPLRMLRAVRLAVALPGFALAPGLEREILSLAPRIREAAAERVGGEIDLLLRTSFAGRALRALDRLGLLDAVLPELPPLRGLSQPPRHHDHDAFEHTLRAVEEADALAAGCPELGLPPLAGDDVAVLKWAALLHDAGKAATASVGADGGLHFYGHEAVSATLAEAAFRRLRVPARLAEPASRLIGMHLRLGAIAAAPGDRPARRLVRAAGSQLPLLARLALADRRAAGGAEAARREADLLGAARRALAAERDVAAAAGAPPLLRGDEIMRELSLPPGPRVGSIVRWIDRLRAEGRIGTRDEAVALLRSLPPPRIRDD